MSPSADRASSVLMRRFSNFATNRRYSKTEAFTFVHFDSFKHQFGIDAAMSALQSGGNVSDPQLLSLLQENREILKKVDDEADAPGWRWSPTGGYKHENSCHEVPLLERPQNYPQHPTGAVRSGTSASAAAYSAMPGSLWLEGRDQQHGEPFYWHPVQQQ